MKQTAILLLAAGASTRLGRPKQLLKIQGGYLLEKMAGVALEAGGNPVIIVLGAFFEKIQPTVAHLPVRILQNERWQEGMGSSVAAGVRFLTEHNNEVEAVMLMLCDQPYVHAGLLKSIYDKWLQGEAGIVAAEYEDTFGVPAIFDKKFLPELAALSGEKGAKSLMMQHRDEMFTIPFPQGTIDLDTEEDVVVFDK
jgi:molybdenum cofactor cytidylyltransferase